MHSSKCMLISNYTICRNDLHGHSRSFVFTPCSLLHAISYSYFNVIMSVLHGAPCTRCYEHALWELLHHASTRTHLKNRGKFFVELGQCRTCNKVEQLSHNTLLCNKVALICCPMQLSNRDGFYPAN